MKLKPFKHPVEPHENKTKPQATNMTKPNLEPFRKDEMQVLKPWS